MITPSYIDVLFDSYLGKVEVLSVVEVLVISD